MTKARIAYRRDNAPAPENPGGKAYWDRVQHMYPFQITVEYFSSEDMDPRLVSRQITPHFTRVTFGGKSHFGFIRREHLETFKKMRGIA